MTNYLIYELENTNLEISFNKINKTLKEFKMSKTVIIYGSTTGNCQSVAEDIASKIDGSEVISVADATIVDLEGADNIILGSSTWGIGEMQDDFASFLPTLASANLDSKTVAIFGTGDGISFGDSFVDAIGEIYQTILAKNCKLVGATSTAGYDYSNSNAIIGDEFVGLPIDFENAPHLTDERIASWVEKILPEFA